MGVGARWDRAAELRRAVTECEIALRRVEENHGARQQELLAQCFHDGLKGDRVEWLEICCRRCRRADRARHRNNNAHSRVIIVSLPWRC